MPRARLIQALVIVFATLAVYWPVLTPGTGFLWDDADELWDLRGELVQASDGPLRAWFPFERTPDGRLEPKLGHGFWPLTPNVLWLEWRVLGADDLWAEASTPAAKRAAVEAIAHRFHWPNAALHAINALLVVALMRRLDIAGAFWIGLVFAVHPIHVPSVAWVSEHKNTLSLCFALLATLCWLRRLATSEPGRSRLGWTVLACLAFFLSLAAKPAAVGLPAVWAALAWRAEGKAAMRHLAPLGVALGLTLFMGGMTLFFTASTGGLGPEVEAPSSGAARIAQAGWTPWFYVARTLWPAPLMMIHPAPELEFGSPASFVPLLALLAVVAGALVATRRGFTWPLVALTALGALVAPVSGLFDMTFMMHSPVSEHFFYMGSVPVIAGVVGGGAWLCASDRRRHVAFVAATLVVVTIFAVMSRERSRIFRTQMALWTHNVAANPEAWMAHYNLGTLVEVESREAPTEAARREALERALGHLTIAAEAKPVYPNAWSRKATVLAELGRLDESADAWRRAVEAGQLRDDRAMSLVGRHARELGRVEMRRGQPEAAVSAFELAILEMPGAWRIRLELAEALRALGRDRAAEAQLRLVVNGRPGATDALLALARLHLESEHPMVHDPRQALEWAVRARRAATRDPARRAEATQLARAARDELRASGVGD